jgi:hypothetical protein
VIFLKQKDTKFHIIYAIFALFFIVGSSYLSNKLLTIAQNTFQPVLVYRSSFAILALFGVILGFEHLFKEKRKDGKWNINILKLIILGIPTLWVIIWHWFPMVFNVVIIKKGLPPVISHSVIYDFAVILFAWVLTTSVYKNDLNET